MSALAPDVAVSAFQSLAEIHATPYRMGWQIKGWWPHPSYGQKGGPDKSLKSWLETYEHFCIASGTPLFGRFEIPKPGPVSVFMGEMTKHAYDRRLRHIARSLGLTDSQIDKLPVYVTDARTPVLSDSFYPLYREALAYEPVRIALDPLYSYHGSNVDASNVHAAAEVLNALSSPALEAGASLSVVNHFRKDAYGTPKLVDLTQAGSREWVDSWVLLNHRERPDLVANLYKLTVVVGSRHWGGAEWDLDVSLGGFDEETFTYTGSFEATLSEPASAEDRTNARLLTTVSFVEELGGSCTVKDYMRVSGATRQSAERHLKEAIAAGDLIPGPKKGNANTFAKSSAQKSAL